MSNLKVEINYQEASKTIKSFKIKIMEMMIWLENLEKILDEAIKEVKINAE